MTSVAMTGGTVVPRPFWLAGLGGLALAVVILLSPFTIWAAAALALLVAASARSLTGLERRLVLGVLFVAIVLRVATIAGLFLSTDHYRDVLGSFPFDGDGVYLKRRSIWLRHIWLGIPIGPEDFNNLFSGYGWTSYVSLLAYIQYLIGPAPYAIHLFNVCCFVAGALLIHRIVRRAYGALTALVALTTILFLPTLFMWSISAMKESLQFLLMAVVVFGAFTAVRGAGWVARLAGLGVVLGGAVALNSIRAGAFAVVVGGLTIALFGAFTTRRVYLFALMVVLLPVVAVRVAERPSIQSRVMTQLRTSAAIHFGHVQTAGHGYKLLDQRFYSGDSIDSLTWPEGGRFLLRAVSSFVMVPFPWQVASRSELMFIPQQLVWYCLVLLAIAGVIKGCCQDVWLTWLLLGLSCAGAAVIAPNSGNIGTMVRHRDMVVPFVACLSAVGAVSILGRVRVRREALAAAPDMTDTTMERTLNYDADC